MKSAPAEPSLPAFPPLPSTAAHADEEAAPVKYEAQIARTESATVRSGSPWTALKEALPASPSSRRIAMTASGEGATTSTRQPSTEPPRVMLDIEATLHIVVEQVATAATELRKLVKQHGGLLIEDLVDESSYASGRFLIRVDAPATEALLSSLEKLGQVRTRLVNVRDIGKQFHDAELQLENLNVALSRYQEILAKAENVTDILSIERELTRLRGEIERVKGNLRWMKDRVARSTIHVNLVSPRQAAIQGPIAPEAKFYPGLRGVFLEDLRGDGVHQGYVGGGISLRAHRGFSLDIDGLRRTSTGSPIKGLDVLLITIGGETFSEFLGNGTRRFANPYLGWRMGYARFTGHSEFTLGATLGLEIVKTRYFGLDLAVRGLGFIGRSAHMAVQPELTLNFAF